jgi:hypothetical protein
VIPFRAISETAIWRYFLDMKHIKTIQFTDIDSGDEALIIVRAATGCVTLCISKMKNGDIEVAFPLEECENLLEALQQAAATARG